MLYQSEGTGGLCATPPSKYNKKLQHPTKYLFVHHKLAGVLSILSFLVGDLLHAAIIFIPCLCGSSSGCWGEIDSCLVIIFVEYGENEFDDFLGIYRRDNRGDFLMKGVPPWRGSIEVNSKSDAVKDSSTMSRQLNIGRVLDSLCESALLTQNIS